MAVAVVADAHLGGPGGSVDPLLGQLRELPQRGCERLLFLGDLFHIWVGDPRFETGPIRAVVPVLRSLRREGLRIDYVEGNRDFFLKNSPYADAFDEVATEVALEVAGTRYLAVHGDGLNDRDWRYRFWRRVSKNPLTRLASRRFPSRSARHLMESMERRLGETNFKHKIHIPETVIKRYAQKRLAEGYDVLLLGHFHEARRWQVEGGEVRVLEAWLHNRELAWIES